VGAGLIVSYEYKFAFIHVPKTGGSTISAILAPLVYPGFELVEKRGWQPQLHNVGWLHSTYAQNKEWINAHSDFLTIAFVRNPFDRIASFYAYLKNEGETLTDFAVRMKKDPASVDWLGPGLAATSLIDFVGGCKFLGRFEDMQLSVDQLMDMLDLPRIEVPHLNPKRIPTPDYRTIYTPEAVDAVTDLWCDDLVRFGYDFEAAP